MKYKEELIQKKDTKVRTSIFLKMEGGGGAGGGGGGGGDGEGATFEGGVVDFLRLRERAMVWEICNLVPEVRKF